MTPYYQDKLCTLYHGDCLEVMAGLEPASFDAVIADPPYGTTQANWDSPIPFASMWVVIKRLIRPRAPIVLFGAQPYTSALVMSNVDWFRYNWIWEKQQPTGFLDARREPMKAHEDIVVFGEASVTYYPQDLIPVRVQNGRAQKGGNGTYGRVSGSNYIQTEGNFPRTVLRFDRVTHGQVHTNQKPLALMEYLVKTYTNEGGRVLDFTCGSGTTLRACKNLGRACVGIEREARYCETTARRLSPAFEDAIQAQPVEDWSGTLFEALL